ncbi:hypothetical protein, partial [Nannocystis pusilla]|uniref:hypothetical protein n=1 Tax=Nannocystis pusilla TaxID=889268 RepID=UPI003BF30ED8
MRIEIFAAVFATAFTLENAMAAPSGSEAEPTGRNDMQATERLDSAEPSAKDDEPRVDAPGTDELRFCALDGCEIEHQSCVC